MEPSLAFMLVSILIFLGFFSLVLFKKTFIPDVIILMFSGILLARLFPSFEALRSLSGYMAHLALATILFEAGLNLKFREAIKGMKEGFALATLSFALSAATIAIVVHYGLSWPWLHSFLLGTILGGTSAGIVIPIANSLPISKEHITILEMESTITNVYNTVIALSIADIITKASVSLQYALNAVLSAFSIGIVLGLLWGIFWIFALKKLEKYPFSYMITIAALFLLYGFVEFAKANGGVAALTFGLVLGNASGIAKFINIRDVKLSLLAKLHAEISFLVRTFFFLYLGTILQFPKEDLLWMVSLLMLIGIFIARVISIYLMRLPDTFVALLPRGLSEAVVISLVMDMGIAHAQQMGSLVTLTILFSNLLTGFMLIYLFKVAKERA